MSDLHPQTGQNNAYAKLTDKQVLSAFRLRGCGLTLHQIARRLNCSHNNVGYILSGKRWKHLYAEGKQIEYTTRNGRRQHCLGKTPHPIKKSTGFDAWDF